MGGFLILLGTLGVLASVVMGIVRLVAKKGLAFKQIAVLAVLAIILGVAGAAISPAGQEGYKQGQTQKPVTQVSQQKPSVEQNKSNSPAPQTSVNSPSSKEDNKSTVTPAKQEESKQDEITADNYKDNAASIVEEYSKLMVDLGNILVKASQGSIAEDELSNVLDSASSKIQNLIDRVTQLDKRATSVYYPGESIHLTTYLSNAVRGTSMVIKSLQDGKYDDANVWAAEVNKDFQKFLDGYKQLK